jgi:hypothetical protein
MNLLSTIGAMIAQGLSHAEVAAKLEAEHAITVSEEWVKKITGADGFALVSAEVGGEAVKVEAAVDNVIAPEGGEEAK